MAGESLSAPARSTPRNKGGRPACPTPKWDARRKVWHVRVTVNGVQEWHDLDDRIGEHQEKLAKETAQLVSDGLRAGEGLASDGGQTVALWARARYRWLANRPRAETLKERQATWKRWVNPVIGPLSIRRVTAEDIRRMVNRLEVAVSEGTIGAKRAFNIWGEVTRAFADACEANDPLVRVRDDNPCDHVRGPEKGDERAQAILRPAEIETLLVGTSVVEGRDDVPLYRRELYAVGIYTACRIGELRGIAPEDVDFGAKQIAIVKQSDRFGKIKVRTKTRRARVVTIEPALMPLLRILVARKGKTLLETRNEDHARLLREDLATVGVTRAALFADDELRMPLTFHGLRHTCLTHMAVRRDPPQDVQWRAGHATPQMTERYIAEARYEAGDNFGTPLAPLPASFLVSAGGAEFQPGDAFFSMNSCEGRELNPYRSNPAGT